MWPPHQLIDVLDADSVLLDQGGDPPDKAAKLVLDIIDSEVNGGFLWIDEPAFYPNPDVTHPSWTIPKL